MNQLEVFFILFSFCFFHQILFKNPKLIRGSDKLQELCEKFENTIILRSKRAREKANITPEATRIYEN